MLTADRLRRLLADPIAARRNDDGPDLAVAASALVPAAVLVGVVMQDEPCVLLTRRTAHLRAHAGQVSFPGGRIDPADLGPEQAALRESWEEIGLEPASAELLGRLPDHITGTGYRITPVTALLAAPLRLTPSAHEVETVFTLPLAVVMDPAAPRRQLVQGRDALHESWVWPHAEHSIWGATAAILVSLAHRLRGPAA